MADDFLDPLLHQRPLLFDATPASILEETRTLINATASVCDDILTRVDSRTANFDNTIRLFAEYENVRSERENYLRFFASTSPSQELRDVSNLSINMFNDAEADLFSRVDLYSMVDRIQNEKASDGLLDDQSAFYLSKLHTLFVANGCSIADDSLQREFVTKQKRLNDVARECRKNMADEKAGLWLTHDDLRGVPDDLLSRLTLGDGENAGRVWLPTKAPFSTPAISNATCEATRKKIYYAVVNRMPQNVPLVREMILLRDETARMLEWRNHFEFKTSQKMVKSSETVSNLLSQMQAALRPLAEESSEELLALKRIEVEARGDSINDLKLFLWDREYYQRILDERTRASNDVISQYFELNTTFQKLRDMYEHLLGVRLIPVDITTSGVSDRRLVWYDEVQMFSAWNMDNEKPEFVGYAYFDFYPREGKYTHAGHYTLQRSYQRSDGSWHYPCSCLVMNYLKPTDERPSLLTLDNVRSLFHEMGHMYHNMLSRAKYARLHSVDRDFAETPSVMLEHFFWDARIIRDVSCHYSHISPEMRRAWLATLRPEQIADGAPEVPTQLSHGQAADLAQSNAGKNVRSAITDFFFAHYDMLVHSPNSHEELEQTSLSELFNKTRADIYRMNGGEARGDGWEFGQGQSVFRGIQGKNDAGYYTYILGRLFALDILQTGFSEDLMNKENGRRYRDMVLAKGGSQPEMKTLADYLGHAPRVEPYLRWLGAETARMSTI